MDLETREEGVVEVVVEAEEGVDLTVEDVAVEVAEEEEIRVMETGPARHVKTRTLHAVPNVIDVVKVVQEAAAEVVVVVVALVADIVVVDMEVIVIEEAEVEEGIETKDDNKLLFHEMYISDHHQRNLVLTFISRIYPRGRNTV